jgi:hypothetical protein
VSDDSPLAPFAYEGLDPVPEPKSAIAEVSEAVKGTINRVSGAIEAGRKPGMPLSILARSASWFAVNCVPVGSCRRPSPMMVWGTLLTPYAAASAASLRLMTTDRV